MKFTYSAKDAALTQEEIAALERRIAEAPDGGFVPCSDEEMQFLQDVSRTTLYAEGELNTRDFFMLAVLEGTLANPHCDPARLCRNDGRAQEVVEHCGRLVGLVLAERKCRRDRSGD